MTDSEERQTQLRRTTSSAQSRRPQTSRIEFPTPELTRLRSGTHLDDHSHYYNLHGHCSTEAAEYTSSEELELAEKDTKCTTDLEQEPSEEIIPGVRHGIEDQRDVEVGPKLEKSESTKSVRDPNLVSWNRPDDPDNPKNWTLGHKWAATLIGEQRSSASIIR
jgi:hypothetical protein